MESNPASLSRVSQKEVSLDKGASEIKTRCRVTFDIGVQRAYVGTGDD